MSDVRHDGDAIPPILSLDIAQSGGIEHTRTLYCGSFSKTLTPGLRIGWVCGAQTAIQQLELIKQASDLHTPSINQMAIHHVASRIFDNHVATIKASYRTRRDAMLAALQTYMPAGVEWSKPEGGMFIWLTLPKEVDGAALLAHALKSEKIAFVPGGAFFADGSGANSMRLSFSCATDAQINEGITRLGRAIRSFQAKRTAQSGTPASSHVQKIPGEGA